MTMFSPKYNITNPLLVNIKRINTLIDELNNRRFPKVVLLELERIAREVSSYASTSIEGNPLPLTEVKKILRSKPAYIRESEKEVINYNKALQDLNNMLGKGRVNLSLELILKIQKQVTDGLLPAFESGHLRKHPVVVNDPRTRQIKYLPPEQKEVEFLIMDLIEFVNNNRAKIDPLILAGIFHKQMVLIHPFTDGNGRTTRLTTKVLLAAMGLNTFNLFSFESYYNQNVTHYFQHVGEIGNYYDLVSHGMNEGASSEIDFTSWLEYFTSGIIDELLRVQKLLPGFGITPNTSLQSYHIKILEFIREKGFITNRDYSKISDRAKATRIIDLQKLVELDLIERKARGRATYYVLKES